MLLQTLRSRWLTSLNVRPHTVRRTMLCLERLDSRDLPAITFPSIDSVSFPAGKDLFVPLAAVDPENPVIAYQAQSSNGQVSAQVLANTTNVVFHVSGKDGAGNEFSGPITLTLFNDLAPLASARIAELADSGFYDGRNFHRVINGFMAQGGSVNGSGSGDSALGKFDDEYQPTVAFTSRGLVAMANAGDDTNDTQFFIVDTDLSLAQMPQHLNFNHTIVGLLTGGFTIFSQLMSTNTVAQNPPFNNENSKPVPDIIISTSRTDTTSQSRVLRVSAPSNFVGASNITVTANSSGGAAPDSVSKTFTVTGVPDTVNDRAFLGPINNFSTNINSSITIDLPATDIDGDQLTFVIRHPLNFESQPENVTVSINQATRQATITPVAGFTGSVDLLIGVRDQTKRATDQFGSPLPLDTRANFDTQVVTLTVANQIRLDTASQSGLYRDDNFTSVAAPSFTLFAQTGRTVTVSVNGSGSFVATESNTPGRYTLTLPNGNLQVGKNVITAVVTGGDGPVTLAPLTITYAPPVQQGVYVIPGAIGQPQSISVNLIGSQAGFKSEVGFFKVDDLSGKIGALSPGDAGYAQAAIQRAVVAMTRDQVAGAASNHTLNGGEIVGFYLIQNSSSATWLTANPTNAIGSQPVAFFSFTAANPDGVNHVQIHGEPDGRLKIGFEDLTGGGDRDYNDRVITIGLAGSAAAGTSVQAPAGAARSVAAQFALLPASKPTGAPRTSTPGEVGFFIVDGPDGRIGHLLPGSPGYVEAALNRREQIFAAGAAVNTSSNATIQGSSLLGFYFIENGSAAAFLASNPGNSITGNVRAFFSFAAANPDSATHFRLFNPEGVTRAVPTAGEPLRIHASAAVNPTENSFDDLLFTLNFAAVGNLPPFITQVVLSPSEPTTNDDLVASVIAGDPDGGPPTLTYNWRVDGQIVRTHTTSQTTDTLPLSLAGNGDRGQLITVEVTASDGVNTSPTVDESVTVVNALPSVEVTLTPSEDVFNDSNLLTAVVNAVDDDGDAFTLRYVWRVVGRPDPIREFGPTTDLADSIDLSSIPDLMPGDVITVEVIGTDSFGDGEPGTAQRTIANRAPAGALDNDAFSGAGVYSRNVGPAFTDPDGQDLTFTAELDDGSPLPTWLTITAGGLLSGNPPASAAGDLVVRVTASDGQLTGSDTFTLSLTNTNDSPSGQVTIVPNPAGVEAILTAIITDLEDGDGDPIDLTYEWKLNGITIPGETGDALDLSQVAGVTAGDTVTVEVTLDDGTETVLITADTSII